MGRVLSPQMIVMVSLFVCTVYAGCNNPPEKRHPQVHTVLIEQMKFKPEELTIKRGDTVIWVNKDLVAHDITEESSEAWTSSTIPSGSSWKTDFINGSN